MDNFGARASWDPIFDDVGPGGLGDVVWGRFWAEFHFWMTLVLFMCGNIGDDNDDSNDNGGDDGRDEGGDDGAYDGTDGADDGGDVGSDDVGADKVSQTIN